MDPTWPSPDHITTNVENLYYVDLLTGLLSVETRTTMSCHVNVQVLVLVYGAATSWASANYELRK